MVHREPLSASAESGHHLVGDKHDAELVTDLAHAGQVTGRGHQYAVRTDDRLQQHGGHCGWSLEDDVFAQMRQRPLRLLRLVSGVEC